MPFTIKSLEEATMQERELLTSDELSARLKVRPDTIREWSRNGLIPSVRITAKVVRFDYGAVVAKLKEQSCESGVSHA